MDAINHQGTDIEAKLLLHEIEDEINMTESFTLAGLVAYHTGSSSMASITTWFR